MQYTKALLTDIMEWDVATWSEALAYWERQVNWTGVTDCLEIGSRKGGLSLWLALRGKQVLCTDMYDTALIASPLHRQYHAEEEISYMNVNAAQMNFNEQFDLVVFKSVMGSIAQGGRPEGQAKAVECIYKALKPGGVLLFAENLGATRLHAFFRNRFTYWGHKWHYPAYDEIQNLLKVFGQCTFHTTGVVAVFGRSERQKTWLSVIDRCLLNFLFPKKWKYVVYGIAVK